MVLGFFVLPRRCVAERTSGDIASVSADHEAKPESSLAWIHIAFVRFLAQRFGVLMGMT